MRALIIGNGVVGKATALALDRVGCDARFYDVLPERSDGPLEHARICDIVFCCVHAGGHVSKDSAITIALARLCAPLMKLGAAFVQRTTCVPGTADTAARVSGLYQRYYTWPEFLREATWSEDAAWPARSVIGRFLDYVDVSPELYEVATKSGCAVYVMSLREAELTKMLANALIALRISAWNSVLDLASYRVVKAVTADPRLASFNVEFGAAYGGKCLPKDLDALLDYCQVAGVPAEVLRACRDVNRRMGGA